MVGPDPTEEQAASDSQAEALAAFGLYLEEPDQPAATAQPEYHLWPEHELAFSVFLDLSTRWRFGPGGPVGLDYPEMRLEVRRALGRGRADGREQLEREVRACERGALTGWSQRRAEEEDRREQERQRAARR